MKYYLLLIVMTFSSCAFLKEVAENLPQPEKQKPKLVSLFPKQEWTDYALELVKTSTLASATPSDGKAFCPNGMNVNNWVHLLAAMSKRESNFKPSLEYQESFKHDGKYVISTGLFQISLASSRQSVYNCRDFISNQADLYDPYKNIKCSVNIMEYWLKRDGVISQKINGQWRGALARYWSVGRDSLPKTKSVLKPLCE